MSEDLRFKIPFTWIVSGLSGSGKSSFWIKLLQNLESQFTKTKFEGCILWFYGEKSAVLSVDVGWSIKFNEIVPAYFTNEGSKPCLIILEDLLNEVYSK